MNCASGKTLCTFQDLPPGKLSLCCCVEILDCEFSFPVAQWWSSDSTGVTWQLRVLSYKLLLSQTDIHTTIHQTLVSAMNLLRAWKPIKMQCGKQNKIGRNDVRRRKLQTQPSPRLYKAPFNFSNSNSKNWFLCQSSNYFCFSGYTDGCTAWFPRCLMQLTGNYLLIVKRIFSVL